MLTSSKIMKSCQKVFFFDFLRQYYLLTKFEECSIVRTKVQGNENIPPGLRSPKMPRLNRVNYTKKVAKLTKLKNPVSKLENESVAEKQRVLL